MANIDLLKEFEELFDLGSNVIDVSDIPVELTREICQEVLTMRLPILKRMNISLEDAIKLVMEGTPADKIYNKKDQLTNLVFYGKMNINGTIKCAFDDPTFMMSLHEAPFEAGHFDMVTGVQRLKLPTLRPEEIYYEYVRGDGMTLVRSGGTTMIERVGINRQGNRKKSYYINGVPCNEVKYNMARVKRLL